MAAGFGLLRLTPDAFWSMTPREIERALSVLEPVREMPPSRAQLAAMLHDFPDRKPDGERIWQRT